MVGMARIELATSAMSTQRSPTELHAPRTIKVEISLNLKQTLFQAFLSGFRPPEYRQSGRQARSGEKAWT